MGIYSTDTIFINKILEFGCDLEILKNPFFLLITSKI